MTSLCIENHVLLKCESQEELSHRPKSAMVFGKWARLLLTQDWKAHKAELLMCVAVRVARASKPASRDALREKLQCDAKRTLVPQEFIETEGIAF